VNVGETGFFGKLPSHGDFIMQRLPRYFVDCWDQWVRASLAQSREAVGEDEWSERYLVTPIWRFYWSGGVCGEQPWLGLFMPSVDNGGRSFPMLVATRLGRGAKLRAAMAQTEGWFDRLEEILLSSLDDRADLEDFDRLVRQQTLKQIAGGPAAAAGGQSNEAKIQVDTECEPLSALDRIPWADIACTCAKFSVWWAKGEGAGHRLLFFGGLPAPDDFADFLSDQHLSPSRPVDEGDASD
jgi:type VI secretion system protein ImpM